jgi:hypothetical protein
VAHDFCFNHEFDPIFLFYRSNRDLVDMRFDPSSFVCSLIVSRAPVTSGSWDVLGCELVVFLDILPACSFFTVPSHASCMSFEVVSLKLQVLRGDVKGFLLMAVVYA